MERNDAITTLEVLKANCSKHSRDYQALDYAISSLKTDETYQLMYEGVEVYDKDTVARMLRELKLEIGKMSDTVVNARTVTVTSWDGMKKRICNIIQDKINALGEDKDALNEIKRGKIIMEMTNKEKVEVLTQLRNDLYDFYSIEYAVPMQEALDYVISIIEKSQIIHKDMVQGEIDDLIGGQNQ